jgi:hypothetical protein
VEILAGKAKQVGTLIGDCIRDAGPQIKVQTAGGPAAEQANGWAEAFPSWHLICALQSQG